MEDPSVHERELALTKMGAALRYLDVLRDAIDDAQKRGEEIRSGLGAGATLHEAFTAVDAPTARRELTDTLAEYERLRHETRLALMLVAVAEGMNKSSIARMWGISPQWAGHEVEAARRMADMTVSTEPEP